MNAQQLKNSILQEAIEGRLVPQDPNDEPASVLLARIRKEKERLVKEGKLKKKDLEETPISEDEKPFEIPDSWEWVRIKTIVSLITKGSSPSWQGIKYVNEGILFITSENVKEGFLDLSSPKHLEESFNTLQTRSILKKGDLLTNIVGASIGRTAEFDLDIDNCNINQAVALIRLIDFSLKPLLLKIFNSPFIVKQMLGKTVETARPNISLSSVENLIIPLPPLAEQHRIVAKIEELLPKVEEYGKAQEALDTLNAELPERLKKSILQEAISGRLVAQDPNDEPASVLLDRIRKEKVQLVKTGKLKKKDIIETPINEDEIPFEIPESWVWVKFGDLVRTSTGKTPPRGDASYWGNSEYPWVSISDMKQGETIIRTKEQISQKAANDCFRNEISKRGTLIMSFKLTVGRTSILGIDAYHNEAIISIHTYSDSDYYTRDYLSYILPVVTTWGDSKDAIKGKTLNAKSIYNLLIPLPPLTEQHRIVAKLEQLLGEVDKLKI